ncbi:hypothetical protein [Bradyrhizobium sp. LMTR 3]|uniref:hypothetical protein n=1 Tax=Bradyrhizobium sp. LMTR 3 TaxID=189873 RepID=UPI000810AAEB|nr:hypothetical protein [Bradyrhizobium sp. LMTR 3]OCK57400.1 hypothetical protein LMTR3_21385 [Bradyrhizobium sp. LMTR 3]
MSAHDIIVVAVADKKLPTPATKCVSKRKKLTTYLRFSVEHRERIRHTDLIERTFGEPRRRVKVIGPVQDMRRRDAAEEVIAT